MEVTKVRDADDPFLYNLLDFSDYNFRNTPCNEKCNAKDTRTNPKPDSLKDLEGIAQKCQYRLDEIQKSDDNNVDKTYNCERLLYFYTCKYGNAYCSEICKAIEDIEDIRDLTAFPYYNILSFGCGSSVDLLAFEYLHRYESYNKKISYYGFDIDPFWEPLQVFIKNNIKGVNVDYLRGPEADVTTYFDNHPPLYNYNIFILSYLFSNLDKALMAKTKSYDYNTKIYEHMFDQWVRNIITKKPNDSKMLIIVNDFASNRVDLFKDFLNEHQKQYDYKLTVKRNFFRYQYAQKDSKGNPLYSKQHYGPDLRFIDYNCNKYTGYKRNDDETNLYMPVRFCQSNQLIIEVE